MDWRDAAAYAPLLAADRSILAWEWLRRDPAYREAAGGGAARRSGVASSQPADWGLHVFEPPDRAAPAARPLWVADVYPPVLAAAAEPPLLAADAFDISRLGSLVSIVDDGTGREHLLISDGLRAIRIDIVAGSVREGPVQLRFLIAGQESAERPLLTLRRLLVLCRSGWFSPALHPPDTRAGRFVLMLRAHDALADGATQREIASLLLSRTAGEARWRSRAPSLRSQVQRLVRAARHMAAGEYVGLLR